MYSNLTQTVGQVIPPLNANYPAPPPVYPLQWNDVSSKPEAFNSNYPAPPSSAVHNQYRNTPYSIQPLNSNYPEPQPWWLQQPEPAVIQSAEAVVGRAGRSVGNTVMGGIGVAGVIAGALLLGAGIGYWTGLIKL